MREVETFMELYKLFSRKQWNVRIGHEHVMENYLNLVSNLNENQKKLIFELTDRYRWYSDDERNLMLSQIANNLISSNILSNYNKIYGLPLKSSRTFGKTKSSDPMIYKLQGVYYRNTKLKDIIIINNMQDMSIVKQNDLVLLFDDFIGTGDTAEEVLSELFQNKNINASNTIIMALVAMNDGVDYLKSKGITYHIHEILTKGISEHYPSHIISEKITIMESIETMIIKKGSI